MKLSLVTAILVATAAAAPINELNKRSAERTEWGAKWGKPSNPDPTSPDNQGPQLKPRGWGSVASAPVEKVSGWWDKTRQAWSDKARVTPITDSIKKLPLPKGDRVRRDEDGGQQADRATDPDSDPKYPDPTKGQDGISRRDKIRRDAGGVQGHNEATDPDAKPDYYPDVGKREAGVLGEQGGPLPKSDQNQRPQEA